MCIRDSDDVIVNVVLDRSAGLTVTLVAAGLFPPVPAVCVCSVFGEVPLVHPAMSTVTATITAVAPSIDILPINVPLPMAVHSLLLNVIFIFWPHCAFFCYIGFPFAYWFERF